MSSAAIEGTRLLPYDAVFRIEVSLSSQKTSAIVMRTTARLYSLEGTHSNATTTGEERGMSFVPQASTLGMLTVGVY